MTPKPRIELINDEIDRWLEEEMRVQNQLDFIHHRLDRLIGEKTLRLVRSEDASNRGDSGTTVHVPDTPA